MKYYGFDNAIHDKDPSLVLSNTILKKKFLKDILPILLKYQNAIDGIYRIDLYEIGFNEKWIQKTGQKYSMNGSVLEFNKPDFTNKNLISYIEGYLGTNGELDMLIKSKDLALLEDIAGQFQNPLLDNKIYDDDLIFTDPTILKRFGEFINNISNDSYLISSCFEENMYCVFASESTFEILNKWMT